jgi:N6-L-threonylcarbamoyladenine synthase
LRIYHLAVEGLELRTGVFRQSCDDPSLAVDGVVFHLPELIEVLHLVNRVIEGVHEGTEVDLQLPHLGTMFDLCPPNEGIHLEFSVNGVLENHEGCTVFLSEAESIEHSFSVRTIDDYEFLRNLKHVLCMHGGHPTNLLRYDPGMTPEYRRYPPQVNHPSIRTGIVNNNNIGILICQCSYPCFIIQRMRVLGIETSCDETAAAVVEDGHKLLSNVVSSSVDLHAAFGGVVPEIAARSHLEVITSVINEALIQAKTDWDDIDAIAVTQGPGLSGSLLIGVLTARTLAIAKNKPLYGVNHVEAHVYANFITQTSLPNYKLHPALPQFPLLALIVSGGHSQLVLFQNHFKYKLLGQTTDDAVGEAYDKVAKILGLPYPGGPSIEKVAPHGNPHAIKLPKAKMQSAYDFSFSGPKTAVLRATQRLVGKDYTFPSAKLAGLLNESQKSDIAASFQFTAIDTLLDALEHAVREFDPKNVVIAGGVAASSALRLGINKRISSKINYADMKLCTDNGAMIASLGYFMAKYNQPTADPYSLDIFPNLSM